MPWPAKVVFPGAVLAACLAPCASADTALLGASPAVARPGDRVVLRAGTYKPSRPMPVYLVPRSLAPRRSVAPTAPRGERYRYIGRIDFRRRPRRARLTFRVPRLSPGVYVFVLFCDRCRRGARGSLIWDRRVTLRVLRN